MSATAGIDTQIAPQIARALAPVVDPLPVRLVAWDGSAVGPADAPVVELRSPDALRRLLWHPGELGAAQAYVTGEVDLPGDVDRTLATVMASARDAGPSRSARATALARSARLLGRTGALRKPLPAPATQAVIRGQRHSKARDRSAISHHYDVSALFYEAVLDASMAYSCAYFADEQTSLEDAQAAKLTLVGRKLGLEPGSRLLDVGCGWGSMAVHAAKEFGASVVGVTISAEQAAFARDRVVAEGLEHLVDIRLCDYRDLTADESGSFDAVVSLEMGEHVGESNYSTYTEILHRSVRPGGRVLVQQMSRTGRYPGGGPFIESFIAPDMHMRPVGETVAHIERSGLEVRDVHALREHYVLTVARWIDRFEERAEELTALVGEEMVRVWRLYLIGGAAAFRDGRMGVDQILSVRPGAPHGLAPVRSW